MTQFTPKPNATTKHPKIIEKLTMSDNRKRNRWDGGPSPNDSVSDNDALNALLSSAESRKREREEQPKEQRRDFDDRRKPRKRQQQDDGNQPEDGHYGPPGASLEDDDEDIVDKQKPNFGLSGALAKDETKGNMYKGVVLKFSEPPEARAPNTQWRLYVFKGEENVETLHISRQSAYLLGRNEDIADIPLRHGSCSSQHAVLQYRALPNPETGKLLCQPYLMDLESTNGSFINSVKIEAARYYQLKKGDVLKFGASTREFVLLTANSTSTES